MENKKVKQSDVIGFNLQLIIENEGTTKQTPGELI